MRKTLGIKPLDGEFLTRGEGNSGEVSSIHQPERESSNKRGSYTILTGQRNRGRRVDLWGKEGKTKLKNLQSQSYVYQVTGP